MSKVAIKTIFILTCDYDKPTFVFAAVSRSTLAIAFIRPCIMAHMER